MDKKSIVNDLYHASLVSVFAVGYSMLDKKLLKMAPPNIQKFDLEDTGKLVAIITASEMMKEYLVKKNTSASKNGERSNVDQRCISKRSCFHQK